jgi:predicted RND superfamily exporter protein
MNNLLFTALLIALIYYFFYYLPQQKQLVPNPILTHTQSTQTDPHPINLPEMDELKKDIQQKEQTIIGLNNSYDKLNQKNTANLKTIQELQAQVRDLAKRPSKPTNSKGTQTDKDLENTLDNLIKEVQDLNNSLC